MELVGNPAGRGGGLSVKRDRDLYFPVRAFDVIENIRWGHPGSLQGRLEEVGPMLFVDVQNLGLSEARL